MGAGAFGDSLGEATYKHVCDLLAKVAVPETPRSANNSTGKSAKRHCPCLDFLLGDLYNDSSDQSKGDWEFELYLAEVIQVDPSFDPLDWWKQYYNKYARVAALARRYLPLPPTSVASERLFSLSGRVVTKTCNHLLPDTALAIVFLNKNMYAFHN